jgi:hypothetical protein
MKATMKKILFTLLLSSTILTNAIAQAANHQATEDVGFFPLTVQEHPALGG